MEPHALSVEEAKAAVAVLQCLGGYAVPIVFLVVGAVGCTGRGLGVVVKTLRLLEPDTTAKRNSGEGGFESAGDLLSCCPTLRLLLRLRNRCGS